MDLTFNEWRGRLSVKMQSAVECSDVSVLSQIKDLFSCGILEQIERMAYAFGEEESGVPPHLVLCTSMATTNPVVWGLPLAKDNFTILQHGFTCHNQAARFLQNR